MKCRSEYVHSVLLCLYLYFVDVSEVSTASTFRVEECRVGEFLWIYGFMFQENNGGKNGASYGVRTNKTVDSKISREDGCRMYFRYIDNTAHMHTVSTSKNWIILRGGGETESTWYCGHYWPILPVPAVRWLWNNWWNEDWWGKPKYSEKAYPSATLSTTTTT
jgi:hypothetical protein